MMIIDLIGDLHGNLPKLFGGDLLIICGDITGRDTSNEWVRFYAWLKKQEYEKKILVGGNHDRFLEQTLSTKEHYEILGDPDEPFDVIYLKDSGLEFKGIKIWGTPWSPWFKGVNPFCKAFMVSESDLKEKFALIPDDTQLLISHSPPFGMLDKNLDGKYCGSRALNDRLHDLNVKLHVFGHIHEKYGHCYQAYHSKEGDAIGDLSGENKMYGLGRLSVNCSLVNENYQDVNNPIRIEVDECGNYILKPEFYSL